MKIAMFFKATHQPFYISLFDYFLSKYCAFFVNWKMRGKIQIVNEKRELLVKLTTRFVLYF